MDRAYRIALLARRYRALAERPYAIYGTPRRRACRAFRDPSAHCLGLSPPGLLDAISLAGASEVDLLCAAAVEVIEDRGASRSLLAAMCAVGEERAVAIAYALSPRRRARVQAVPEWGYAIAQAGQGVEEALARLEREVEAAGPASELARAACWLMFTEPGLTGCDPVPERKPERKAAGAGSG